MADNNFVNMAFEQRSPSAATPRQSQTHQQQTEEGQGEAITDEDFTARARELGVGPEEDAEEAFSWIVYKSFADPLPEGWELGFNEEGIPFYFNNYTEVLFCADSALS
jgi:hypothetical protein